MNEFFKDLFDLSFSRFVTPKLATIVYVLVILGAGLGCGGMIITAAQSGIGFAFSAVVSSVFIFFATVIAARVAIESSLALFQIARYSAEIARRGRHPQNGQNLD